MVSISTNVSHLTLITSIDTCFGHLVLFPSQTLHSFWIAPLPFLVRKYFNRLSPSSFFYYWYTYKNCCWFVYYFGKQHPSADRWMYMYHFCTIYCSIFKYIYQFSVYANICISVKSCHLIFAARAKLCNLIVQNIHPTTNEAHYGNLQYNFSRFLYSSEILTCNWLSTKR